MGTAHRRVSSGRLSTLFAIAAMAALLVMAAPAFGQGQSSAQQGYSNTGEKVQTVVDPKDPKDPGLPFTGLDVVAVLAVGGALLAVGLGVRRVSRTVA
jgi:hypothetical protein